MRNIRQAQGSLLRDIGMLVFLMGLFTVISVGIVRASVLDQSQEQIDNTHLVISSEWKMAQTFTAGITGQLDKVDLYLENIFAAELYPTTISVVSVIDGVPSGSVLGEVYAENLCEGFNSIEFLSESIFLTADTHYGIALFNDDPNHYEGPSTQWRCISSDVYSGGALWVNMSGEWTQTVTPPDDMPDETYYDKDAAFRTYVVPEPVTILFLGLGGILLIRRQKEKTLSGGPS